MSERGGYDVVVIGGGAAGLSAALALGRARRSVLVIDAGEPRNAPAAQAHDYLGREGVEPLELLRIGRAEVAMYGVEVVSCAVVTAARRADGRFRVSLRDGSTRDARRVVVATGLRDRLPDVPGLAERWGRTVLHCPFCHGWEVRDQTIGILATGPLAVHQALLWRQWSPAITLFLNDTVDPTGDEREQLAAREVHLLEGEVERLDDGGVRLTGGRTVPCAAVVVQAWLEARTEGLDGLGLTVRDFRVGEHVVGTHVEAGPTGATAVPGMWVAGTLADPMEQLVAAAASGLRAGAAVNADLVAEDTRRAVEAARLRRDSLPHCD